MSRISKYVLTLILTYITLNICFDSSKMSQRNAAEIARERCNNDWRSTRPSLLDRFKHLCLREELSDVDFVFNKGLSGQMVLFLIIYNVLIKHSRKFLPTFTCSASHLKFLRSCLHMMEMKKRNARSNNNSDF